MAASGLGFLLQLLLLLLLQQQQQIAIGSVLPLQYQRRCCSNTRSAAAAAYLHHLPSGCTYIAAGSSSSSSRSSRSKTIRRVSSPAFNPLFAAASAATGASALPASAAEGRDALPSHLQVFYQRNLHVNETNNPLFIVHRRIINFFVRGPSSGGSSGGPLQPEEERAPTPQHQQQEGAGVGAPDCVYRGPSGAPVALWHSLSPLVSSETNFSMLRIPVDHPARSPKETFYKKTRDEPPLCLRTHTSAHIPHCLQYAFQRWGAPMRAPPHRVPSIQKERAPYPLWPLTLLISGEVYRRDAIDSLHFPVFHQMDVVRILPPGIDAFQDFQTVNPLGFRV